MTTSTESLVIDGMLPELEAQGFEAFVHPAPPLVPAFLGSYRPDVIAIKGDRKLAIEVKHQAQADSGQLAALSQLFHDHPDWEFRVVWISPSTMGSDVAEQTPAAIRARLAELRDLIAKGFAGPALLLAWATFEALGRSLLGGEFKRPQTTGRLVEAMAFEGHVTPDEADFLRALAVKRNRLAHGDLETMIEAADVEKFVAVIASLLESSAG